MTEKQLANYWYMKGVKDAETTVSQDVGLSQTLKDFETHFELQYKPKELDSLPPVRLSLRNKVKEIAFGEGSAQERMVDIKALFSNEA
jgi:hypothetical protein